MDYTPPTAFDMPNFEVDHLTVPDPSTPLGMKGMAEGGTMGAAAAISNAVADALAPLGIVVDRQPFGPDQLRRYLRTAPPAITR